jgi:protein phosphatase
MSFVHRQTSDPNYAVPSTCILPPPLPATARVRVEIGAETHVGKVRKNNEDQYLFARLRKSIDVLGTSLAGEPAPRSDEEEMYMLLVADGIGGYAAGERASALVIAEAEQFMLRTAKWFYHLGDPDEALRARTVQEGLDRIDQLLHEMGRNDLKLAGMGTTFTGAGIAGPTLSIVHVGDSRAYWFRDGRMEQLTRDHTIAQMLVDEGVIRPDEAKSHRFSHVLTNALGGSRLGVKGEIHRLGLANGDRVLLCTDGLTDVVSDEQIAEALRDHARPQDACQNLVQTALEHGGPDNVTVVLAVCTFAG